MSRQNNSLSIVFAGTPEFARVILEHLTASAFRPSAVLTQPDRPRGRNRKLLAGPVKQFAVGQGMPVNQPATLRDPGSARLLAQYEPDLLVVAAYGLILPPNILTIPRYGCLNVHASLLPRWRGAAPIERAIMAGDSETGVCIMHMEAGLDTGPVYACDTLAIPDPVDAQALEASLAERGALLLIEVMEGFAAHKAGHGQLPAAVAQDNERATYADKLTGEDRIVDWRRPAAEIARQVNALAPRLPVRCQIQRTGVQLLHAQARPDDESSAAPGTLTEASKQGLVVRCAIGSLQINRIRVERGKGAVLDPASAINGFADLFTIGHQLEPIA